MIKYTDALKISSESSNLLLESALVSLLSGISHFIRYDISLVNLTIHSPPFNLNIQSRQSIPKRNIPGLIP
jgi:hypothetical protein